MTVGYAPTLRNARMDQITAAAGASALIRLYAGTQPATGGTATTLLATLTCAATFAPASASGVLTLNTITGANAVGTGTATWFRITTGAGVFVADGTVGTSGADLNLNSTAISSGIAVSITSATLTEGNP